MTERMIRSEPVRCEVERMLNFALLYRMKLASPRTDDVDAADLVLSVMCELLHALYSRLNNHSEEVMK